jgi:hypothetical protein
MTGERDGNAFAMQEGSLRRGALASARWPAWVQSQRASGIYRVIAKALESR